MEKRWDLVADAINTRLEQLGMAQNELALKSRVSVATIRDMQGGVAKRRNPRTLADLSEALGWSSDYLERVSDGQSGEPGPDRLTQLEAEVVELKERVASLERGRKAKSSS